MTEIARRPAGALAVNPTQTDWTPDQRAALQQLGLGNVPRGVMQAFLTTCQRTGLDPWSKQIYLLPLPGGFQTFTGIDGYRVIAKRSGKYRGQTGPEWCGEDGIWVDVWLRNDPPAAARVGVLHADNDAPLYSVAKYDEYMVKATGGGPNSMWRKMPAAQLAKCAEALALRKAFPNDMGGVLTREEMQQAGQAYVAERTLAEMVRDSLDYSDDAERLTSLWWEAGQAGVIDAAAVDPDTGEVLGTFREHLTALAEAAKASETSGRVPDPPIAADEKGEDGAAASVPSDDPWSTPVKGAADATDQS